MSELFNGKLLAKLSALQLPDPEGVVLNSSGALAEWGVIPMESVGDIDATISQINYRALAKRTGWYVTHKLVGESVRSGSPVEIPVIHDEDKEFDLHLWDFSHFDYNLIRQGRISLSAQIERSVQDPKTRIWVATVDYVERTKRETGRVKDEEKLRLIAEWRREQKV